MEIRSLIRIFRIKFSLKNNNYASAFISVHLRLILVLFFIFNFSSFYLSARETEFPQKIEWKSNANALEYKVELQNVSTGRIQTITTDKNFTELSLVPGKYRYRVTAYDFLGKAASVSNWTGFEVFKANTPKIRSVEQNIILPENQTSVGLDVNISDVNAGSKFELVNENLEGSITADERSKMQSGNSETENITHLDFKDVPPGKWRLRVTNPSGYSSISDVITITGEKTYTEREVAEMTAQAVAESEAAIRREFQDNLDEYIRRAEEERIAREQAEAERIERERLAEEERRRIEAEKAERRRIEEEKRIAEENARLEEERIRSEQERKEAERIAEEERKAAEKEAKRQAKLAKKALPYKWKDISLIGGAGYTASIYDSTIRDYYDSFMVPSLNIRAKILPFKGAKNKFGFEIGYTGNKFEITNDFYTAELISNIFDVKFVWQRKIVNSLFLSAKGGFGMDFFHREIEYTSSSDANKGTTSYDSYKNALVTAGVSVFYIPWKCIVCEAGVDFTHVFVGSTPQGFVTPYVALGLRF